MAALTVATNRADVTSLTVSLSKSISIFHASLGENARLAREVGDQKGDAYWSGLVAISGCGDPVSHEDRA